MTPAKGEIVMGAKDRGLRRPALSERAKAWIHDEIESEEYFAEARKIARERARSTIAARVARRRRMREQAEGRGSMSQAS